MLISFPPYGGLELAPFQKEWLPAGRKASSLAALLIRLIVNVYESDYSIRRRQNLKALNATVANI